MKLALMIAVALLPSPATLAASSYTPSTSTSTVNDSQLSVETSGNGRAYADGVSVVDGDITIEGTKVPHDARRFTAQSGKVYLIERSGDHISVRSD